MSRAPPPHPAACHRALSARWQRAPSPAAWSSLPGCRRGRTGARRCCQGARSRRHGSARSRSRTRARIQLPAQWRHACHEVGHRDLEGVDPDAAPQRPPTARHERIHGEMGRHDVRDMTQEVFGKVGIVVHSAVSLTQKRGDIVPQGSEYSEWAMGKTNKPGAGPGLSQRVREHQGWMRGLHSSHSFSALP